MLTWNTLEAAIVPLMYDRANVDKVKLQEYLQLALAAAERGMQSNGNTPTCPPPFETGLWASWSETVISLIAVKSRGGVLTEEEAQKIADLLPCACWAPERKSYGATARDSAFRISSWFWALLIAAFLLGGLLRMILSNLPKNVGN